MPAPSDRNLGLQPIGPLMEELRLTPRALVDASPDQLTHKMVARAVRGRWLTPNSRAIIQRALCAAAGQEIPISRLFNY